MTPGANYPEEALEAARPFVVSFLKRRGLNPRGQEADTLTGYVLTMAAPFIRAQAMEDAATQVEDECSASNAACFCNSADWLRARAVTERGGE
jgi:hypothetical protein